MNDNKCKRVILWTAPRSISTAFYMCMVNNPQMRCVLEPYCRPYYFGSDRTSDLHQGKNLPEQKDKLDMTFHDVTAMLENEPLGDNEMLFVKDMAKYVIQKYGADVLEYLPKDVVHTFLIRNPGKSIPSIYRTCKESTGESVVLEWEKYCENELGIKELYELYTLLKQNEMGSNSKREIIVVDSDILLENPEEILKLYCDKVGITYIQEMIDWEIKPSENPEFGDVFDNTCFFKDLYGSKRFERKTKSTKVSLEVFPGSVQKKVDGCMEYYNSMLPFCLNKESRTVQQ